MEVIHAALSRHDIFENTPSGMKSDRGKGIPYRLIPEKLDPPLHPAYRHLLNPMLSPPKMRALEPAVREHARSLAAAMVAQGGGEFMSAFAKPLAARVFLDLFGLRTADAERFTELSS